MLPDTSLRISAARKKRPLSELRGAFRDVFGKAEPLSLEQIEEAIADGCRESAGLGVMK